MFIGDREDEHGRRVMRHATSPCDYPFDELFRTSFQVGRSLRSSGERGRMAGSCVVLSLTCMTPHRLCAILTYALGRGMVDIACSDSSEHRNPSHKQQDSGIATCKSKSPQGVIRVQLLRIPFDFFSARPSTSKTSTPCLISV